jgi:hypothetical protein
MKIKIWFPLVTIFLFSSATGYIGPDTCGVPNSTYHSGKCTFPDRKTCNMTQITNDACNSEYVDKIKCSGPGEESYPFNECCEGLKVDGADFFGDAPTCERPLVEKLGMIIPSFIFEFTDFL